MNNNLSDHITQLAAKIIERYTLQGKKIVTAESCTGGLIAAALTEIPGSSHVVERGFVTYSNDAKTEVLGVMPEFIFEHGAVSREVAEAMAQGALDFSRAQVAVSVTGIAGPGGATIEKPVGLVFIGIATKGGALFHLKCEFKGTRQEIRQQAVREALNLLIAQTEELPE